MFKYAIRIFTSNEQIFLEIWSKYAIYFHSLRMQM